MRRYLLGGALILWGSALLWSAFRADWQIARTPLAVPEGLKSFYPALEFKRLEARETKANKRLIQHLVHYQDAGGTLRQALLPEPGSAKWRAWMELSEVLRDLEPNALVITWWDNSQRVDFLSGRKVFVLKPPEEAFAPRERKLWEVLSGGFADSEKLAQLAKWWVKESSQALAELAALAPVPAYLLVSSDDLAHLDEIERLAGKKLPLEAKLFPQSANFHTQIAQVKRWSQGKSYLPQKVPGGVVAWRLTEEPAPFLLYLLLFTPLLKEAQLPLTQIYHSPGGYLRLYRLNFDLGAANARRWLPR